MNASWWTLSKAEVAKLRTVLGKEGIKLPKPMHNTLLGDGEKLFHDHLGYELLTDHNRGRFDEWIRSLRAGSGAKEARAKKIPGDWAWTSDREIFVPEVKITKDDPTYVYHALRGYSGSVAVEDINEKIIGWMPIEVLGYSDVKSWMESGHKKKNAKESKMHARGKSVTPKYRVEFTDGTGPRQSFGWDGKATTKRLEDWVFTYAKSLESGGVNAHISESLGKIPYPTTARLVEQKTGDVVATWKAAPFQAWEGNMRARDKGKGIRSYGAGKFYTLLDSLVYEVVMNGFADQDASFPDGNGAYALVSAGPSLIEFIEKEGDAEALPLTTEEKDLVLESKGVIFYERSDGIVEAEWFDKKKDMDKVWKEIEKDTSEAYGDDE